jgi:hypothetical protein
MLRHVLRGSAVSFSISVSVMGPGVAIVVIRAGAITTRSSIAVSSKWGVLISLLGSIDTVEAKDGDWTEVRSSGRVLKCGKSTLDLRPSASSCRSP